ncbi:prepilin-type N-terminal cleavage/methylation domain-containing protein [Cerasicoccus maritimus]|uniref:prepilin-type N-terminal cleavage/methylation domain-containing protein n=1 Tax=Cerasicoccus maritimus TaxID=490089 RepID=UPI00285272DE|nr:prepilin-type N-terminal cleavage/methylation domain-containing protein [Cerasicoccus maritimus]
MKIHCKHRAFTLVEILVTVGVVGVLSAVTVAAVGKVKESAYKAGDVTAARQLVSAYLMYPQEHKGQLLPSNPDPEDRQKVIIYDHNGNPVSRGVDYDRYVFRLLPYVDGIDAFYPGRSQVLLDAIRDDPYDVALFPSFGLNVEFMGGDYDEYSPKYVGYDPNYKLTTLSKSINPSQQIVFASSFQHSAEYEDVVDYVGLVNVDAPHKWSSSYNEEIPGNFGNVHLRYNQQAIVANLDGSVELLGEEELRDMRRWSNVAQDRGNANYKP